MARSALSPALPTLQTGHEWAIFAQAPVPGARVFHSGTELVLVVVGIKSFDVDRLPRFNMYASTECLFCSAGRLVDWWS